MSSYIGWIVVQTGGRLFPWMAANPEKVALISLSFWYERKLTTDIVWGAGSVMWRSIVGGTGPGIIQTTGRALATRWPTLGAAYQRTVQLISRHPMGTIIALDIVAAATAVKLSQHEAPATSATQVRSPGFSFGGLGSWGIGTGGSSLIG